MIVFKITPINIGFRYVVGVKREAARLGKTTEEYFALWRNGIKNSALQRNLKEDVLSNIDYNEFYGRGVIVLKIVPQRELSYVGEELYYREADTTHKAEDARQIAALAKRF